MADRRIFDGKPVLEFSTGLQRRSFLKYAGLVGVGAGLVVGGGVFGGGVAGAATTGVSGRAAAAAIDMSDIDILNYALTLEYLEADFYATGLAAGLLSDRELELVTPIGDHENQHVSAVTEAVKAFGGTPATKPKITYPAGVFDSRDSFLKNASVFEELGVTAYHGQVPLIKDADVLASAASIAGVESRHAAVVAALIAGNPFPNPIEANASMDQVLATVKPFIS
ncbi:ferritin-like domain-containing protein [Nakamurella flava]|uniref:Ferritin-like domain-containing protein n=1 Tax=Nakamurella flava TaxID=2576308 RepID=A0A4U6QJ03_9ACTN|nr:ferritin-like domain-containing protein [Nakamurella flava]TKV60400.1 ferritin-like domain-containing protein [Nakamurella flava]